MYSNSNILQLIKNAKWCFKSFLHILLYILNKIEDYGKIGNKYTQNKR